MSAAAAEAVVAEVDRARDDIIGHLQTFLGFKTESQNPEATISLLETKRSFWDFA